MYFIDFIIYPLVYIIFMPLLTLLHELGHTIPALIFTKGEVIINIGNSNLNKTIKLNRLVINLNGYKSLLDVSYGYVNLTPIDNRIKLIFMILGGPLTTLLISISLYIYLINSSLPYVLMLSLNGLFLFSAFEFLITILPIKYSFRPYVGCTSDGYKILQYLKSSN
ncbi:hypothetical protein [Romboutsia lituseburensis]|uniref:hypothetical protein n=1 Tax=Romboutsia lituseburensis TaxID=1537 RepID=UPI00215B54C7|nr:hypothetical protein [Romboutsia lituseburensis]MCR8743702.1 hypothetical protein [Romboutsia lituseburensis]